MRWQFRWSRARAPRAGNRVDAPPAAIKNRQSRAAPGRWVSPFAVPGARSRCWCWCCSSHGGVNEAVARSRRRRVACSSIVCVCALQSARAHPMPVAVGRTKLKAAAGRSCKSCRSSLAAQGHERWRRDQTLPSTSRPVMCVEESKIDPSRTHLSACAFNRY